MLFLLLPLFAEYFYLTMIFQMGLKPIKLAGMNFGMVTFPPISTLPLIFLFCLVGCSTNDYLLVWVGGLHIWDPLMKGIGNLGCTPRIPNHRALNQQLTIS